MPCGCGQGGGQSTTKWTVTPADGSGVKEFTNKPDADVYAARSGGIVRAGAAAR